MLKFKLINKDCHINNNNTWEKRKKINQWAKNTAIKRGGNKEVKRKCNISHKDIEILQ